MSPAPDPWRSITFRVRVSEYQGLAAGAAERSMTVSQYVRAALVAFAHPVLAKSRRRKKK